MSNQLCVVRVPEQLIPEVANWLFVDAESGDLFDIDSVAGVWTRTRPNESEPYMAGAIDRALAAAILRAVYELHHPNQTEH